MDIIQTFVWAVLALSAVISLHGCARFGFSPTPQQTLDGGVSVDGLGWDDAGDTHTLMADGLTDGSMDGLADGLPVDGLPEDGPFVDAIEDVAPSFDASIGDAATNLLFELRTLSARPETFTPGVIKSGFALRWELGDGTTIDARDVKHTYEQVGEKVVRVFSPDGGDGITNLWAIGCQLTGRVPAGLNLLSSLRTLELWDNRLTQGIPAELGQLSSLEVLDLGSNGLSSIIPAELGALSNLGSLYLSSNSLLGAIPPELGSLTKLENLYLSSNQLIGPIPAALGGLGGLLRMSLQSNQLNGTIPAELGQLSKLEFLWLHTNQLTGYAPGAFSGLFAIQAIQLQDNLLDQTAVDAIINDLYQDRGKHTSLSRALDIYGTNAAPSVAGCAQITVLRDTFGWFIHTSGC
ncbi:MAG: leucine-rich repeat domain-containing protein [Deltaproteobacteria bacterium]|nr:leucine-rich repeat domain-containing protein [Deltaproteobacteria bacterium]